MTKLPEFVMIVKIMFIVITSIIVYLRPLVIDNYWYLYIAMTVIQKIEDYTLLNDNP